MSPLRVLFGVSILAFLCRTVNGTIDCATVGDGLYEDDFWICSSSYYRCAGGVLTDETCANASQQFNEDTQECADRSTVRSCICEDSAAGLWAYASRSCVHGSELDELENGEWIEAWETCVERASAKGRAGRLAIVDTPAAFDAAVVWGFQDEGLIALHTLSADATDLDEIVWVLSLDPLAYRPLLSPLPWPVDTLNFNDDGQDCGMLDGVDERFKDKPCFNHHPYFCEEFFDACASNPCAAPMLCVPDTPRIYTCVCPTGKSGPPLCETEDALFCEAFLNGWYSSESKSCFTMEISTPKTWFKAFATCHRSAFGDLIGRLAHVTSQNTFDQLQSMTNEHFWIGLRSLIEQPQTTFADFGWHLNIDNPNAVVSHSYEPSATIATDYNRVNKYCIRREGNDRWKDKECVSNERFACEYFSSHQCKSVVCPYPRVCVPDTLDMYHCVCPRGYTGANCETQDMVRMCETLLDWEYSASASPNSCYKAMTGNQFNFEEALAWCRQFGDNAHLAFIESQPEHDYLISLITGDAFIGAKSFATYFISEPSDYVWTKDGLTAAAPIDFQPSAGVAIGSSGAQTHLALKLSTSQWGDRYHYTVHQAVCEIEVATLPPVCESATCQNNGTCVATSESTKGYTCSCIAPYYGEFCENYCNETWSDWSDCSRTCDYGIRSRNRLAFTPSLAHKCNISAPLYQFEPCDEQPCRTYAHPAYEACVARNGFFTNNACYFLATSPVAVGWEQIFSQCQTKNATVAHLYDTSETMDALSGYLLSKHADTPVWFALKAVTGSGANWMSSSDTEAFLGMFSYTVPDSRFEVCVGMEAKTTERVQPHYMLMHELTCGPAELTVFNTLCMTKTSQADYQTSRGKRIRMLDASMMPESFVAADNWQCGYECRKRDICLAYNYKSTTNECQLLQVKQAMPTQVNHGGTTKNIFELEYAAEWNLYNRRY